MKRIKTFERYSSSKGNFIDMIRKSYDSKFLRGAGFIISAIDDIIHFDFKSLYHSIENRSGYKKIEKLIQELGILKSILSEDEEVTFSDLKQYNFDPNMVTLLEDPDVLRYFSYDKKVESRCTN